MRDSEYIQYIKMHRIAVKDSADNVHTMHILTTLEWGVKCNSARSSSSPSSSVIIFNCFTASRWVDTSTLSASKSPEDMSTLLYFDLAPLVRVSFFFSRWISSCEAATADSDIILYIHIHASTIVIKMTVSHTSSSSSSTGIGMTVSPNTADLRSLQI